MINLNKYTVSAITLLTSLVLFVLPSEGHAQFIDVSLNVNSELSAQTEQLMDFGTLQTDAGKHAINFGSTDMGIFSITALENQTLLVRVDKPKNLFHQNPAVEDKIPINLFSRYGYAVRDLRNSEPLVQATQRLWVKRNPDPGPWNSIYLYIYGSLDIGNITAGVYSNNIVLEVQYI